MSVLKRLWTRIVRFVEALEGIDDPIGDYMFSVGKRIDKLERGLDRLERQQHSRLGSSVVPDHAESCWHP